MASAELSSFDENCCRRRPVGAGGGLETPAKQAKAVPLMSIANAPGAVGGPSTQWKPSAIAATGGRAPGNDGSREGVGAPGFVPKRQNESFAGE